MMEPNSMSGTFTEIDGRLKTILQEVSDGIDTSDVVQLLGARHASTLAKLPSQIVCELTLRGDILRVLFTALYSDGRLSNKEEQVARPLVERWSALLAKLRPNKYGILGSHSEGRTAHFFQTYWKDKGPFGYACEITKWQGLNLCAKIDQKCGGNTLGDFADCLLVLANSLIEIDGWAPDETAFNKLVSDLSKCRDRNKRGSAERKAQSKSNAELQVAIPRTEPEVDKGGSRHKQSTQVDVSPSGQFSRNDDQQEHLPSRLTSCPDCGQRVSKRASSCPNCGCPISGKATESRLTVFRVWVEAGSARRTAIHLDDRFMGDVSNSDGTTFITTPGEHSLKFSQYSLLSGGLSNLKTLPLCIEEGEHLIVEFTPYGGLFGSEFQCEVSQKLS